MIKKILKNGQCGTMFVQIYWIHVCPIFVRFLAILKVWLYLDNEMTNLASQQSDLECLTCFTFKKKNKRTKKPVKVTGIRLWLSL